MEEVTPWGPLKRPVSKPRTAAQPREVRVSDEFDTLASEISPSDLEATISETLRLPAKPRESDDFTRPSFLESLYDDVMKTLDKMWSVC